MKGLDFLDRVVIGLVGTCVHLSENRPGGTTFTLCDANRDDVLDTATVVDNPQSVEQRAVTVIGPDGIQGCAGDPHVCRAWRGLDGRAMFAELHEAFQWHVGRARVVVDGLQKAVTNQTIRVLRAGAGAMTIGVAFGDAQAFQLSASVRDSSLDIWDQLVIHMVAWPTLTNNDRIPEIRLETPQVGWGLTMVYERALREGARMPLPSDAR